jgi:ABC-2 type transport system permease protein
LASAEPTPLGPPALPAAGAPAPAPGFARIAGAFLRRDLAVAASYRAAALLQIAQVIVAIASFGLVARFLGGEADRALSGGTMGFWVTGLAFAELFHVAASAWSTAVRQAQLEGTLEAVLSTPAPVGRVVLSAGLFAVLVGLARAALYLGAGAAFFGVRYTPAGALTALVVAAVALVAFVALGVLGGALAMSLRRADPISALAWLGAVTVGGVFYPVELLPAWAQPLSAALPVAPALEAFRAAVFAGAGLADVAGALIHLGVFVVLGAPMAAFTFAWVLARARADGSLTQY